MYIIEARHNDFLLKSMQLIETNIHFQFIDFKLSCAVHLCGRSDGRWGGHSHSNTKN